MKVKAKYKHWVQEEFLVLTDEKALRSLTNDMENVLEELHAAGVLKDVNQKIIYRDSMNTWDGVQVLSFDPVTIEFYSLASGYEHATTLEEAIKNARQPKSEFTYNMSKPITISVYEWMEDFDNAELNAEEWKDQLVEAVEMYNTKYHTDHNPERMVRKYITWKADKIGRES